MDTSYITEALTREQVRPEAVIDALARAETYFGGDGPEHTAIDAWVATLKGEAGHLFAPPPVAPVVPDLPAWLSPIEKLARGRPAPAPRTRPQPVVLSAAEQDALAQLDPTARLTAYRATQRAREQGKG